MNEIFGLSSLNARQIDPADLEKLAFPATRQAIRTSSAWAGQGVALGWANWKGEATKPPLLHEPTGVRIVSSGRLHNRPQLLERLGIGDERQSQTSDCRLILEAYLKYGENCAEQLLGDWVFAIWDPREQWLLLGRDPIGMLPLFYHASFGSLYFSTSMKGLLALQAVPKLPDLLRTAQMLSTWPTDGVRTYYEGISYLPAGRLLKCTESGHATRQYWTPEPLEPAEQRTDEDWIESFLEIYTEAVRCRIPAIGKLGVTLSGGLDSGSVAALAARELRRTGSTLQAFSSAPAMSCTTPPGRFTDETPYIEADRKYFGNLEVRYVRGESMSPLMGVDRALAITDSPTHAAGNMFWLVEIMEAAQELDVRTLLTGQMGNLAVSWSGDPLASSKAKLRAALLSSWARPLRFWLKRLKNQGQDEWLARSPISLNAVKALDIGRRRKEQGFDPNFVVTVNAEQARRNGIERGLKRNIAYWSSLASEFAISVADPTFDRRIIEFILATPIGLFRGDGMDRRLMRRSMEGLLPDEVRLTKLRGLQAADLGSRILATKGEIREALHELEKHPIAAEMLNLTKMHGVLNALQEKIDVANLEAAGAILMRGLSVGRFLTRF